jgi:hypothetical protein
MPKIRIESVLASCQPGAPDPLEKILDGKLHKRQFYSKLHKRQFCSCTVHGEGGGRGFGGELRASDRLVGCRSSVHVPDPLLYMKVSRCHRAAATGWSSDSTTSKTISQTIFEF